MKPINTKRLLVFSTLIVISLSFSACSSYTFPWVYRLDIEQGNVINEEKLAKVRLGMTRVQVRFLLGTPLIEDTFNKNRWDYFHSYKDRKGNVTRNTVTLNFSDDRLTAIDKKPEEKLKLKY